MYLKAFPSSPVVALQQELLKKHGMRNPANAEQLATRQFVKVALTHNALQCEGSLPAFVSPEADRHKCFQAEQTLL